MWVSGLTPLADLLKALINDAGRYKERERSISASMPAAVAESSSGRSAAY
jgi:hypothetical protein